MACEMDSRKRVNSSISWRWSLPLEPPQHACDSARTRMRHRIQHSANTRRNDRVQSFGAFGFGAILFTYIYVYIPHPHERIWPTIARLHHATHRLVRACVLCALPVSAFILRSHKYIYAQFVSAFRGAHACELL